MSHLASDVRYDRPGPSSFESWRAPSRRLKVRWLGSWTRQADDALAALPPMRNCPPDLYRMMMMNTDCAKKRCALSGAAGYARGGVDRRSISSRGATKLAARGGDGRFCYVSRRALPAGRSGHRSDLPACRL
jgi:hypothetical protein